jgi:hypothetical protein
LQGRIGVEADGGDIKERLGEGAAIEGFDVAQGMGEAIAGDADFAGGEAVEHECIVGVRTMGDGDVDDFRGAGDWGI